MADEGNRVSMAARTKSGTTIQIEARRLPFGYVLIPPFENSRTPDVWLIEAYEPNTFGAWRGTASEALKVVDLMHGIYRSITTAARRAG